MHGDFAQGLTYNALAPVLLAYLLFLWVVTLIEAIRERPLKLPSTKIAKGALTVLAVFWVVRLVGFFTDGGVQHMLHDSLLLRGALWIASLL